LKLVVSGVSSEEELNHLLFGMLIMSPPAIEAKKAVCNPALMSVVLSVGDVCDSVRYNPCIYGMAEAINFELCTLIEE